MARLRPGDRAQESGPGEEDHSLVEEFGERVGRRVGRATRDLPQPHVLARAVGGWRQLAERVVRWMLDGYQRVNAGDLAAAVAFNALLAIVPTILLMITVAGLLLRDERLFGDVASATQWLLPAGLSEDSIQALIEARQRSGIFAVASLVGFLWVGANFFASLGRSMNRVYEVPDPAPVKQRLRGFCVVVAFAVLFIVTTVAALLPSLFFGDAPAALPLGIGDWPLVHGIYQALSYVVAVLAAILLFGMLFRVVPNAGQRVDDVLPGTVVIAFLFVGLVQIFPLYLSLVRGFNPIGSAFAFLPLLLVWFYLLAHLLLFGAYINATYRQFRRCRIGQRASRRSRRRAPRAAT